MCNYVVASDISHGSHVFHNLGCRDSQARHNSKVDSPSGADEVRLAYTRGIQLDVRAMVHAC